MRLIYSDDAVGDLERLRDVIVEHDPSAAKRIAGELTDGIDSLLQSPRLGRKVAHSSAPENMRELVVKQYVVRYQDLGKSLLVLRIWHQRENR